MGSVQDIMQTFAHRDIRVQFPDHDGWHLKSVTLRENSGLTFRVSRYFHGQNEQAFIAVSLEQKPSASQIAALKTIPQDGRTFKGYFLLVPQDTDVSDVPEEIRVLFMSSFGFVDGRLIWITKKKNAIRYPVREPVPA